MSDIERIVAGKSIYQQIYAQGARDAASQASMVNYDHAHHLGQQEAWGEAPSRLRWFLTGAAVSACVSFGFWWQS